MYTKIPTVSPRIHPSVAFAAILVTALCIVATAAIAGWLPATDAMPRAVDPVSAPGPAVETAAQVPSQQIAQPRATNI